MEQEGPVVRQVSHPKPTEISIPALRRLLAAAFTPEELRRLCESHPHPDLKDASTRFKAGSSLEDMVDALVGLCERRLLFGELLSAIETANPNQYNRWAPQLYPGVTPEVPVKTGAPQAGPQPSETAEEDAESHAAPSGGQAEEYDTILDDLARALVGERCALFLGPACSETITLRSELGLTPGHAVDETPTRRSLVCNLAKELDDEDLLGQINQVCGECPECSHCLLPEASSRYEEAFGRGKLMDFLRTQLRGGKPRGFHRQLWNLRFAAIYTINYDELIETSLDGASLGVVTNDDVFATVSLPLGEGDIPFYKLHGSINAADVVITQDDQLRLRLQKGNLMLWKKLNSDLQSKVFLFVGYPLGDTDVLESIFTSYTESQRPSQSYAVIDRPPPRNALRLLRRYNIKIVHKNVDLFFEDLVRRYRTLVFQISQVSTTIPFNQRFQSIGESFKQVVDSPGFRGLCLYGKGENPISKDRTAGELRVIPTEMEDECRRRQARGERILCASLNIAQLGVQVYLDPWRSVRLLRDLADQLDRERAAVRLPSIALAEKLTYDSTHLWENEANARVLALWRRVLDGNERAIAEAEQNPTPEQMQAGREKREAYLTGQAADWLDLELESALAGHRLILFITNFELIEADDKWFTRVSQSLLNKLCDYNVGLVITRQASSRFSAEKTFSAYTLDRFEQYNVAKLIEGGRTK